jgi:hypothetical protein
LHECGSWYKSFRVFKGGFEDVKKFSTLSNALVFVAPNTYATQLQLFQTLLQITHVCNVIVVAKFNQEE